MRLAPEVLRAGQIEWQLWLTLTWRGQVPRPDKRQRLFRLYLRLLARKALVPFGSLVWFCREEGGEQFGRPHFHVLIAGLPSSRLTFDFGVSVGQLWAWGWCEGRLWVRGLGALDYSCEEGANIYEGKKFVAGLPIMLSESLAKVVGFATGDNVEREDAEHSDNPEESVQCLERETGLAQRQPDLRSVKESNSGRGHLAAVNVSRTQMQCTFLADITGAL